MYYYIFEPAGNQKGTKLQEEVKQTLESLGIVGEAVTLSLAEEPPDLARVGMRKNFSTVVAVGSDKLINEVGSGLIGTEAVFGAIPLSDTSAFHPVLGTKDYTDACKILPQRKVLTIDTAIINGDKSFISKIRVSPKGRETKDKRGLLIINFDNNFQAETRIKNITVANVGPKRCGTKKTRRYLEDGLLDVFIPDDIQTEGGFLRFFKKPKAIKTNEGSIFHPKKIAIESRKKIEAFLEDKIIAKGNLKIESVPKSLKIIIKRERPKSQREVEDIEDV